MFILQPPLTAKRTGLPPPVPYPFTLLHIHPMTLSVPAAGRSRRAHNFPLPAAGAGRFTSVRCCYPHRLDYHWNYGLGEGVQDFRRYAFFFFVLVSRRQISRRLLHPTDLSTLCAATPSVDHGWGHSLGGKTSGSLEVRLLFPCDVLLSGMMPSGSTAGAISSFCFHSMDVACMFPCCVGQMTSFGSMTRARFFHMSLRGTRAPPKCGNLSVLERGEDSCVVSFCYCFSSSELLTVSSLFTTEKEARNSCDRLLLMYCCSSRMQ